MRRLGAEPITQPLGLTMMQGRDKTNDLIDDLDVFMTDIE